MIDEVLAVVDVNVICSYFLGHLQTEEQKIEKSLIFQKVAKTDAKPNQNSQKLNLNLHATTFETSKYLQTNHALKWLFRWV